DLDLGQSESLADDVMKIGSHAMALPFLGHRQLRGKLPHFHFGLLAFGDVERGGESDRHPFVADPSGRNIHPALLSLLRHEPALESIGRIWSIVSFELPLSDALPFLAVNKRCKVQPKQLITGEA